MRRIFTLSFIITCVACPNSLFAQSNSNPTTTTVSSGACGSLVADFSSTSQGFVSPSPYTTGGTLTLQSGTLREPAGHANGNRTITLASPGYTYNGANFTLVGFTLTNASTVRVNVYGSTSASSSTTFTLVAQSSTSSSAGALCFRLDDIDLTGLASVRYEVIITTSGSTDVIFDNFQLGAAGTVLPVKFQTFEAAPSGNSVSLKWVVATEENLSGYSVEKSTDGKNFSKIGFVAANSQSSYTFTDNKSAATIYYRIRSVDMDGKYAFSTIAIIKAGHSLIMLNAFPSPFTNSFNLDHATATTGSIITISGQDGRAIKTVVPTIGSQRTFVDLSAAKAGMYLLRYKNSNGEVETLKIFKQ